MANIFGTSGNDLLNSTTQPAMLDLAADFIDGLEGDDTIVALGTNDTLVGGAGNDILNGGDGNDSLIGGSGTDTLYGGNGNDIIRSDGDSGTYYGDAGNDLMYSGLGNETMNGGSGIDTIDHTIWNGDYVFNMTTGLTNWAGELYLNFENAIMGGGNDSVTGNASVNRINGGAGNDTLDGGAGNDRLFGGNGNDSLIGGAGKDTLYGGNDNDIIRSDGDSGSYYGDAGNDLMYSGLGNETMNGGSGIDTIDHTIWNGDYVFNMTTGLTNYGGELYLNFENAIMGSGNDNVTGNASANTINGGAGNDILNGGDGNDSLIGDAGTDTLYGGNGNDIIRSDGDSGSYYGDAGNDLMYSGLGNETMDGGSGIDTIDHTIWNGDYVFNMTTGLTNYGGELYLNFENAIMGGGNDNVTGNASANTINGGAGNDTLYGGSGNDVLDGGTGADIMYGGVGNDTYYVDANVEFFSDGVYEYANEGIDTIISSVGYFIDYSIWVENLTLTGTADFGYGNNLNNTIIGNSANNNLWGNSGNDSLSGGAGNDRLNGYGYFGSTEYDTLTGGLGADTFELGNSSDSYYDSNGLYSGDGYAIITDFKYQEGDKLQLKGNASLYTESDENWGIGTSAFDTAIYKSGDLIALLQDVSGGNFILSLDSVFV
jgi:Ca2+-binding RTX toxin-like protein